MLILVACLTTLMGYIKRSFGRQVMTMIAYSLREIQNCECLIAQVQSF